MWPFKRKVKNGDYDLAVLGDSLAGYVAVLAAIEQGLRVVWLPNECDKPRGAEPVGFDSLSPEGGRYLAHLLTPQDIDQLQCGRFDGVHRNGNYTPFDKILGCGFQLSVVELKQLLKQKIAQQAKIIQDQEATFSFEVGCLRLSIRSSLEPVFCRWVINAQGENSPFSQQGPTYLSEDVWVERRPGDKSTDHKGAAFFHSNDNGWRWIAYDDWGHCCETRWAAPGSSEPIAHNAVNARWYKRPTCLEYYDGLANPTFLIGSTFCRLDPACGLGATLHIKTAIHAVACIARSLSQPLGASCELTNYEKMMASTFNEIAEPMANFYHDYGVSAGKYYSVSF